MEEYQILKCPHCNEFVYIIHKEINCGIFRHGVFKHNNIQMDPHSSKEICDNVKQKDLIWGCGKPFQVFIKDNLYYIQICDYI